MGRLSVSEEGLVHSFHTIFLGVGSYAREWGVEPT